MEPILKLIDVTKRFGGLTAVNKVSLEVFNGEVVGIVGDNGAGKSTLIKMISGVYQPDEGEVYFKGNKCFLTPQIARTIGIETIYQDLALSENLDVTSNIFLGREFTKPFIGNLLRVLDFKLMKNESREVLNKLKIEISSLNQQITNLSGGQRQAVAIARAVYWDALLMIMDEPTAALGVSEQQKVLNLVHTIRNQGVPVIIISHNMQDVMAVADRIIVMRRGYKVGERMASETSIDEIVGLMVGAGDEHKTKTNKHNVQEVL